MLIPRQFAIDQIAPWLVSGASGWYIVARARKLSRASPSAAPWLRFLAEQSDIILVLCCSPAAWHLARRRSAPHRQARATNGDRLDLAASATHQLRQVFTVLLLGLGMIARKASEGKTAELADLVPRLQRIARIGARVLVTLDPLAELVPANVAPGQPDTPGDGNHRSAQI